MEASASTDCPICLDILTEPTIIPCGHVICRTCLVAWLQARQTATKCPLCRYPILGEDETPDDFQMRLLAVTVANDLPTHLVVKAIARGRHDVTPDTCSGCEGLLCESHYTRHLLCPGPQDPQQTSNRQFQARTTFQVLSEKLQKMREQMAVVRESFKTIKEKLIGQVPENEATENEALSVVWAGDLEKEAGQLCTILTTHQHLMEGLQESHHALATILMKDAMDLRVKMLTRKVEKYLHASRLWSLL
ncbi:hypothetical protein C0Q70_18240 [Pomacea canaliculata]|uniref:RING-type domain-containing protein n=1 Tax=Pomacea canaliculata TaxID=400727 RepID=A0A2T7NMN5_POMCA|nr:hypothetical protein C0Q70_18240 [Pomacea canaliculata]